MFHGFLTGQFYSVSREQLTFGVLILKVLRLSSCPDTKLNFSLKGNVTDIIHVKKVQNTLERNKR